MANWPVTVALRSESGPNLKKKIKMTQLNILEYKWHLSADKVMR